MRAADAWAVNAATAATRRLLGWAVVSLVVAVVCAFVASRLPHYPDSWFVYGPDDAAVDAIPVNPTVRRFNVAAIAAGGFGLMLLGAYLVERVSGRDADEL